MREPCEEKNINLRKIFLGYYIDRFNSFDVNSRISCDKGFCRSTWSLNPRPISKVQKHVGSDISRFVSPICF